MQQGQAGAGQMGGWSYQDLQKNPQLLQLLQVHQYQNQQMQQQYAGNPQMYQQAMGMQQRQQQQQIMQLLAQQQQLQQQQHQQAIQQQQQQRAAPAKSTAKNAKKGKAQPVDDDPEVEVDQWVQCVKCQTWRIVPEDFWPDIRDADDDEDWYCKDALWDVTDYEPHTGPCC